MVVRRCRPSINRVLLAKCVGNGLFSVPRSHMRAALSDQGPSAIILKTPRELVTAIFLRWLLSLSLISTSLSLLYHLLKTRAALRDQGRSEAMRICPRIFLRLPLNPSLSLLYHLWWKTIPIARRSSRSSISYIGIKLDPQWTLRALQHFEGGSKTGRLEKRITLRSKLDIAKMLEAAGKYVKFLEAQVHLLKSMPNGLGSARTLNPPTKKISLPMALEWAAARMLRLIPSQFHQLKICQLRKCFMFSSKIMELREKAN